MSTPEDQMSEFLEVVFKNTCDKHGGEPLQFVAATIKNDLDMVLAKVRERGVCEIIDEDQSPRVCIVDEKYLWELQMKVRAYDRAARKAIGDAYRARLLEARAAVDRVLS